MESKRTSCLPMSSPHVSSSPHPSAALPSGGCARRRVQELTAVPLATLLSATEAPTSKSSPGSHPAILSPDGKKRYLVVHGGPPVSKDGVTLDEISKIERYGRQPGQEGLMCEMLWTDPQEQPGRSPSKRVSCVRPKPCSCAC